MLERCTLLINQVLWGNHSEEEWLDLYAQYNAIVTTATEEELNRLEESGIGEILYMICSGSNMSGIMQSSKHYVRYIGEDAAEIRNGEIYQAEDLQDSKTMIGVLDRSGERYAYPKELFQLVEERNIEPYTTEFVLDYIKRLRSGEVLPCPECKIGVVSTEYDPKISHFFSCDKCDFMINID